MKTLERNKIKLFYANIKSKTALTDEYDNLTGEYDIAYDNPVEIKANVSAARGEATTRQFGDDESYDRVIVLDDPKFPISVSSVLWIDTLPEINADGSTDTPHDYIVRQVATSLNSVSFAVSKVTVR